MQLRFFRKSNSIRILYYTHTYADMLIEEYVDVDNVVSKTLSVIDTNGNELRQFVSNANNGCLKEWIEVSESDIPSPTLFTIQSFMEETIIQKYTPKFLLTENVGEIVDTEVINLRDSCRPKVLKDISEIIIQILNGKAYLSCSEQEWDMLRPDKSRKVLEAIKNRLPANIKYIVVSDNATLDRFCYEANNLRLIAPFYTKTMDDIWDERITKISRKP